MAILPVGSVSFRGDAHSGNTSVAGSSGDVLPYSHGYTYYDLPDEPHCFRRGGPYPKPSPSPNPNLNPNQMRPTGFDEAGPTLTLALALALTLTEPDEAHWFRRGGRAKADHEPCGHEEKARARAGG